MVVEIGMMQPFYRHACCQPVVCKVWPGFTEDWFFADPLVGADGTIVVVGQLPGDDYYNRAAGFEIPRFTARGVLDRSFSDDGVLRRTVTNSSRRPQFEVDDSALDVHGNIWLCGMTSTATRLQSATAFAIAADGSGELPGSRMNFTVAAGRSTSCRDITSSPDGAIIVAATDDRKIEAIKRTAIGVLDPDFGESGVATIELVPADDPNDGRHWLDANRSRATRAGHRQCPGGDECHQVPAIQREGSAGPGVRAIWIHHRAFCRQWFLASGRRRRVDRRLGREHRLRRRNPAQRSDARSYTRGWHS